MKQIMLFVVVVVLCSSFILLTRHEMGSGNDGGKDNTLTKAEKKAGFKLLFDGSSLDQWRTYKNEPGFWQVTDGQITSEKPSGDKNPDLITKDEFESFDLQIDWKISPQGNSGIMYHATEEYAHPYESGPEYQLIDDKGFPQKIEVWQTTGANYAMNPPKVAASKPVGEWNHTEIIVNKTHVEHWLNGQKVVEYEFWNDEWNKHKAEGKWKDAPGYGMAKKGHIALQASHSGVAKSGVSFKNIKIKEL